jgi:hypothetical protein
MSADTDADGWDVVEGWSMWMGALTARCKLIHDDWGPEMRVQVLHEGRVVAGAREPASALTILEWMEEDGTLASLRDRVFGVDEDFELFCK